jgi:hypothetical protein
MKIKLAIQGLIPLFFLAVFLALWADTGNAKQAVSQSVADTWKQAAQDVEDYLKANAAEIKELIKADAAANAELINIKENGFNNPDVEAELEKRRVNAELEKKKNEYDRLVEAEREAKRKLEEEGVKVGTGQKDSTVEDRSLEDLEQDVRDAEAGVGFSVNDQRWDEYVQAQQELEKAREALEKAKWEKYVKDYLDKLKTEDEAKDKEWQEYVKKRLEELEEEHSRLPSVDDTVVRIVGEDLAVVAAVATVPTPTVESCPSGQITELTTTSRTVTTAVAGPAPVRAAFGQTQLKDPASNFSHKHREKLSKKDIWKSKGRENS